MNSAHDDKTTLRRIMNVFWCWWTDRARA